MDIAVLADGAIRHCNIDASSSRAIACGLLAYHSSTRYANACVLNRNCLIHDTELWAGCQTPIIQGMIAWNAKSQQPVVDAVLAVGARNRLSLRLWLWLWLWLKLRLTLCLKLM